MVLLLELFRAPPGVLGLPLKASRVSIGKKSGPGGIFPKDSLAGSAKISFIEELAVILWFGMCLGGPVVLFFLWFYMIFFATWTNFCYFAIFLAILAFHPVPNGYQGLLQSGFALAVYKYFTFRVIVEDMCISDPSFPAWIGASPPHGVLPIANIISMLGVNTVSRSFYGAGASVVAHTPFLRYMGLFGGMVDVSAKSIISNTRNGVCIGIVPDGIAGMFKTDKDAEVVYLKNRMGLAKLALRTGIPIVPAYSIGNTQVLTPWFDSFGIMETVSRKLKASLLLFWGRWGLPIPRRTNITMLCAKPVVVDKLKDSEITPEKIREVHEKILSGIEHVFNKHKAAVGWEHKEIRFI